MSSMSTPRSPQTAPRTASPPAARPVHAASPPDPSTPIDTSTSAASPATGHGVQDTPTRIPLAIEDTLTVLIMALLALITFANVVVRYFTSVSFAWTEEISIFLMVLLTVVGSSAAYARNRHIRIDLLVQRGSARRQWALARFGTAMVVVLFGMMAVLGARMVWDEYLFEETSPGIGVPQWWYTIWLPILSALIALRALGLYVRQSRAALAAGTTTPRHDGEAG